MSELTLLTVPVFSTLCNAAFNLRREVFVVEQNVPQEEELDAEDMTATHVVAILAGEVVGTLRLLHKAEHIKIGRVAVRRDFRGQGIARAMIEDVMAHWGQTNQNRFYLTSQTDKIGMYEKYGFVAYGEEFLDAGIPHYAMKNY
jgi:predicted GNAT family N-acyltransferase